MHSVLHNHEKVDNHHDDHDGEHRRNQRDVHIGRIEGFIDDLQPFFIVILGGRKDDRQPENTGKDAEHDGEDVDKVVADDAHREMEAGREEADTDNGDARPDPRKVRTFVCEMLLRVEQLVFGFGS